MVVACGPVLIANWRDTETLEKYFGRPVFLCPVSKADLEWVCSCQKIELLYYFLLYYLHGRIQWTYGTRLTTDYQSILAVGGLTHHQYGQFSLSLSDSQSNLLVGGVGTKQPLTTGWSESQFMAAYQSIVVQYSTRLSRPTS